MGHDTHVEPKTKAQRAFEHRHHALHMRKQVINFAIMIFLTFVAFAVVIADFSPYFIKPIILLLAGVQVVLQLYSFMHMDDKKGHHINVIQVFVWMGALIAFTFFLAFNTVIWW